MTSHESWTKLRDWLKGETRAGRTVLMPLKAGTKMPMFRHSTNSSSSSSNISGKVSEWDWAHAEAYAEGHPEHGCWGLLLDGLVVVDADDAESVALLEGLEKGDGGWEVGEIGEAMRRCAVQETNKGRHYVFLRPPWADEAGYYDGARQVKGLCVDVKTLCSTGTRGLLSVAPTAGKRWVAGRAPWELADLPYIPRALLEMVATNSAPPNSRDKRVHPPNSAASTRTNSRDKTPNSALPNLLLSLLSRTRWERRDSWRDIATALKNEDDGGDAHKALWKRMSRASSKYDEEAAEKLWNSVGLPDYEGPKLTLRTVAKWAREDDPHGYAMYRAASIPGLVRENWDKGDYGLAQVAQALLRETVKKTGPGRGDYYHFEEAPICRWARVDEGRVKSVACRALEEALRDVEVMLATQASSQCGLTEEDSRRKADLDAKKKEAAQMIKYVRSQRGVTNVMGFAGPLLMDEAFEQGLDGVRHLIGIKGGFVVDLRTGEKRPRTACDMVHNELDVEYDSQDKSSSSWMHGIVTRMMGDDGAMASYLQRLLGYGITGEVREEVFPIWTGSGRNGKGLLTQALQQLLGSYYKEMNCAIISDSRVCSNIDAERAKLIGARVAVFNELKAGEKLKTNEVQLLTGGDGFPAKALYQAPTTVMPRHLAILVTNYMPEMSEVIVAMVERLLVVEFPVTFRDLMPGEAETATLKQCDRTLKDRLKSAEGQSSLFAWLVEGAVAWYAGYDTTAAAAAAAAAVEGLRSYAPAKVREYTRSYLAEQDKVQAFLTEECEFGEGLRESSASLYGRYRSSGHDSGEREKWFHTQMKSKGFLKKSTRVPGVGVVQGYEGLALKRMILPASDSPQ